MRQETREGLIVLGVVLGVSIVGWLGFAGFVYALVRFVKFAWGN